MPHPILKTLYSLLTVTFLLTTTAKAQTPMTPYTPFEGEKTTWHDNFARYDYVMDEATHAITPYKRDAKAEGYGVGGPAKGQRRCIVVVPNKPAPGNPWSWQGCYWDHEPQGEVELLRRGFHIVFITPSPDAQWDAWYKYLTEQHGLAKKPAFIGMSMGGINNYDWTTNNPDKVSCIYADNPGIRPETFAKLDQLAKNDVALLNICGSEDFLLDQNTLPIEEKYHRLGGQITLMIKEGAAHHPHSLRNPKFVADWIESHMHLTDPPKPEFVNDTFVKSYYYALDNSFDYLKEENTYFTGRGPGFVPSYERYDVVTNSQWGIKAMAIVVPKTAAPGKPWVFRADRLGRDSTLDQALLAKGYHIVVAPITEQAGSVQEQWDTLYKFMTDHGFSTKPVMEGTGTAAGEAYAWAIANPTKVSCIYAENPALRSLMNKTPILDNLGILAQANIPLIHDCGSLDPWLQDNTKAVEKKYKDLGGKITVFLKEGVGHYPTNPQDPKAMADLIATYQKN